MNTRKPLQHVQESIQTMAALGQAAYRAVQSKVSEENFIKAAREMYRAVQREELTVDLGSNVLKFTASSCYGQVRGNSR